MALETAVAVEFALGDAVFIGEPESNPPSRWPAPARLSI